MSEQKECFVISPIGEGGSDIRDRSDEVLEHIIKPPVEDCGYEVQRADKIEEPGMITSQVIERVGDSPLVVADLTGSNPNVFYELAVRHAFEEPLIQLIDVEEDIPFDVAGSRIIQYSTSDLSSAEKAKEDIRSQIKTIESDQFSAENPISVALDVRNLREQEDPESDSLADIKESISDIRNTMTGIQNTLNDPEEIIPERYLKTPTRRSIDDRDRILSSARSARERADEIGKMLDEMEPSGKEDKKIMKYLSDIYAATKIIEECVESDSEGNSVVREKYSFNKSSDG